MKKHFRLVFLFCILTAALPQVSRSGVPEARVAALSSRGTVRPGGDTLIAGVVIGGTEPKDVLIRAVGPTLAKANVKRALGTLRLQLFDRDGQEMARNEAWSPSLKALFTQVGAAPLTDNSNDAALHVTLPPGIYTAHVSGVGATTGVALVEVYEVSGAGRLLALSTRARVESGEGILISGLVVTPGSARRVLLRAAGPALAGLGVSDVLADPGMSVIDGNGTVVATNENWSDNGLGPAVSALAASAGAFPFANGSKDAALVVDLLPGLYTVHVKGAGTSTGIALLEAYDVTDFAGRSESAQSSVYSVPQLSWAKSAIDTRLGPTFEELNPGAPDTRPTLTKRASKVASSKFYVRIKPFELGDTPETDSDYWSDSGNVAYVPDDPVNDPGLDRIQTYAYYSKVFAISPRFDDASGRPHPEPQTRDAYYVSLNGGPLTQPVAMVRNYAMEQNEAIVIYRDGLFAVAGTQTSRTGGDRPYPGFKFPPNKIPRAVAVTTSNEFALVTIWDTDRHVGQLAVVALEGKYLPFHTWPYMALPNQGSFSDFKLLGYVDLPMATPDSVAAASNGLWTGPSATDNRVLSQIDLSDDHFRALVYDGAWQGVVAKSGYAIVSSKDDDKVVILDLTPLLSYARESWLGSATSYQATLASRGPLPEQFPQTFDVRPGSKPKIIWQSTMASPTAVLAGHKVDRWSVDRFKAYVATSDGTVHIIDTSSLMARSTWHVRGPLQEIGTVQVARNPVSLAFARHSAGDLPLLPRDKNDDIGSNDPLNNLFYVACRGDREIDAVVTFHGEGAVYERVKDSRLGDPVAVGVARRGNILIVADFAGKKILSFLMGPVKDTRNNKLYAPIDPNYKYEFAGELPLAGSPFLVNSTNVN